MCSSNKDTIFKKGVRSIILNAILRISGKHTKEERKQKELLLLFKQPLSMSLYFYFFHFSYSYIVSVTLDTAFLFCLRYLFYYINLQPQFLNLLINLFDDSKIFHHTKYYHLPEKFLFLGFSVVSFFQL